MMIFHITTPEDWKKFLTLGKYKAPSLETEGFIHCSTQSQILTIANTFYSDYDDLVLLKIDAEKLTSEIKWESPIHPKTNLNHHINDNELFPHIYGAINLDAIIQVLPLVKQSKNSGFVIN